MRKHFFLFSLALIGFAAVSDAHAASVRVRASASSHVDVRNGATVERRDSVTMREERGGASGSTSVRAQTNIQSGSSTRGGTSNQYRMRTCLRLSGMEKTECYERQGKEVQQGMRWVMGSPKVLSERAEEEEKPAWWRRWRERLLRRIEARQRARGEMSSIY